MKKRPKLIIVLGALVCVAIAAALVLVHWWRQAEETRIIHWFHGGAIVRSFFNAGLDYYLRDHGDIPEAWKKLCYFPNTMDEQFGSHADSFWQDIAYLPGSKRTRTGIENFRVWFLDKAETKKLGIFSIKALMSPKIQRRALHGPWPGWFTRKRTGRWLRWWPQTIM